MFQKTAVKEVIDALDEKTQRWQQRRISTRKYTIFIPPWITLNS